MSEEKSELQKQIEEADPITAMAEYLFGSREYFWNTIKQEMEYAPTISAYTTTRNCISQEYPFELCIKSVLSFCHEVVVVDANSSDGTWERLEELAKDNEKLRIYREVLDYDHPRFAVFDGKLKAIARDKCTQEFCLQIDSDEIIPEVDGEKYLSIAKDFPSNIDLLALPVVEFWGSKEKIRMDINPWKWRLSRNKSHITHGIPKQYRRYDDSFQLYSEPFRSDGCDYVNKETFDPIPFANFYTVPVEQLRRSALTNEEHRKEYENWFKQACEQLPKVLHFSWWNIERKIKTYKNYWQKHWLSLYNVETEDTAENNMFFDKAWSEVSDEEIKEKAKELSENTGGHIFHSKWNGEKTPHVYFEIDLPKEIY